MATLADFPHSLETSRRVTWSTAQEKGISNDFPFDRNEETPEQFVFRTYLQFLWLPESIMPLHLLSPSLRRVHAPSTSTVHPLHALLDPLLLTTGSTTKKYREELPKILMNGGGAGEMEEMMMWYAVSHEKAEEDDWTRSVASANDDGPWVDDKWRKKWLDRMERREVQIQIILHLLKLSLPGPAPPPIAPLESPKKRKRSVRPQPAVPVLTLEDHLEVFMDKLSMWQLVASLDLSGKLRDTKEERDWMQIFCEDIVEPQYNSILPDQCSTLQSKVFPQPLSDRASSPATERSASPEPANPPQNLSRAPSTSRQHSPALSTASGRSNTTKPRAATLARSRSLSISLEQERREKERAGSVGVNKKRVLNREVSMSRVFKSKPKIQRTESKKELAVGQGKEKAGGKTNLRDVGVTLVEETPVKPRARSSSQSQMQSQMNSQPVGSQRQVTGRSTSTYLRTGSLFGSGRSKMCDEDPLEDSEEIWQLHSSPDVLLLNPEPRKGGGGSVFGGMMSDVDEDDEDGDFRMMTPSKPSRRPAVLP